MAETQPENNTEELQKQLADLKLENQSLKQQVENIQTAPQQGGGNTSNTLIDENSLPQTTTGFEPVDNRAGQTESTEQPENTEMSDMRKELQDLQRKNAVNEFAEENNLTAEQKKAVMEGVVEKGLSVEDSAIYAQGKMMTNATEARGIPTPPQSEADTLQQQQEAERKAGDPNSMSADELEKAAAADFESANQSRQSITA